MKLKVFASALIVFLLSLIMLKQAILSVAEQNTASEPLISEATPTTITAASSTSTPAPYTVIFSQEPGPDVPSLQELAGDETSDAAIIENVLTYYEANRDRLAILWREDNPTRLAGLFAMYITHISLPYGEATPPSGIAEFITQPYAHCGTYVIPQAQLVTALGLTWRTIEFVAEHAFMEIYVDDHWELFDATTNTWIDHSATDLMRQVPRQYRYFYTPMLDINRPDARSHMALGYNMQTLRLRMPTMGVVYMPPGEMIVAPTNGPLAEQISS